MYNLHPFFASFPVVILFLLCFVCIFKSKVSFWLDVYGMLICSLVIFCLASFFSGFYALDQLTESQIEISLLHQQIGRLLMIGSFALLGVYFIFYFSRGKKTEKILDALIIFFTFFAIYVGYHGASLVFDYGLGVMVSK